MTYTDDEQQEHRAAFIQKCRQKAWGAACEADYIGDQVEKLTIEYTKLKEEDDEIASSPEHHTVANRERRKALAAGMKLLQESIQDGQGRMERLLQQADQNLAVAFCYAYKSKRTSLNIAPMLHRA